MTTYPTQTEYAARIGMHGELQIHSSHEISFKNQEQERLKMYMAGIVIHSIYLENLEE